MIRAMYFFLSFFFFSFLRFICVIFYAFFLLKFDAFKYVVLSVSILFCLLLVVWFSYSSYWFYKKSS